MKVTFTDVGLSTQVDIVMYKNKTSDGIVSATGYSFLIDDDQVTKYKTMAKEQPRQFKAMIMRKQTKLNKPETIIVGKAPKLDNSGKLMKNEIFEDIDADYLDEKELRSEVIE